MTRGIKIALTVAGGAAACETYIKPMLEQLTKERQS